MSRRILSLLFGSRPAPPEFALAVGEEVAYEGLAALVRGPFGGRWGPLALTNRRLLWHEAGPIWPLKRQSREIPLDRISLVDKGSAFDAIFGGRRIRLHLDDGRIVKFFEGQGNLDAWITQLRARTGSRQ